jgi:hypothetical protein
LFFFNNKVTEADHAPPLNAASTPTADCRRRTLAAAPLPRQTAVAPFSHLHDKGKGTAGSGCCIVGNTATGARLHFINAKQTKYVVNFNGMGRLERGRTKSNAFNCCSKFSA